MSSYLAPLYQLLHKNVRWRWSPQERKAFQLSTKLLLSSQVLAHFDPKLDIVLACDASAYGISTVLSSYYMPDGTEKPIGFSSRTLSEADGHHFSLINHRPQATSVPSVLRQSCTCASIW